MNDLHAKMTAKLHELGLPAKRIEMIGSVIHITISGHGETSTATANKWISVLTKLGKVTRKETIEQSHKYDAQRGVVDYVNVTKVWCTLGGSI